MSDLISRQAAIDAHYEYCNKHPDAGFPVWSLKILENLPSAQPETHDKRTETHACDLIDRQAAIDAADRADYTGLAIEDVKKVTDEVVKELKQLPSAQLEKRTEERAETHACDLISRKMAIDAVDVKCLHRGIVKGIQGIIEDLPSAQPERKKGKWIDYTDDGYVECPFCHSATNCDGNKDELHFCFSCGADMRGVEE